MSQQTWVETLVTSQVDGPTLSAFSTATTVLPSHAIYTLPSNYMYIGRMLRIRAFGRMSSFTSGTFTWQVMLGPTSNIIAFTSGAITNVVSLTNQTYDLEIILTCRSIGSGTATTLMGVGEITSSILTGGTSAAQAGTWVMPTTAPAVGTGFDSTVANQINLFLACSVSNAANAQTCHMYSLEAMN
jgi:hypothetical protein